jgi:hypothetical protein
VEFQGEILESRRHFERFALFIPEQRTIRSPLIIGWDNPVLLMRAVFVEIYWETSSCRFIPLKILLIILIICGESYEEGKDVFFFILKIGETSLLTNGTLFKFYLSLKMEACSILLVLILF